MDTPSSNRYLLFASWQLPQEQNNNNSNNIDNNNNSNNNDNVKNIWVSNNNKMYTV